MEVRKINKINNLSIMFLLPVPSQPRFFKRIESIDDLGVKNKIFSFEREYFTGKENSLEYESLGHISHGKYFSRILPFLKALFFINKHSYNFSCVYAFGLDCALLGIMNNKFLRKKNKQLIIYECADIRSVFLGDGFKNTFFRFIERWVMTNCYLIVTTSPAFIEEYFIKIQKQNPSKFYLLENKIKEPVPQPAKKANCQGEKPLIIGYFGLLRCQRSFNILAELVRRKPNKFKLYIKGYNFNIKDMEKVVDSEDNIEYGGPFAYPEDLSEIYGKVDIVWAAYPFNENGLGNWRWAMTNRFYECCYYKTPMVAQFDTQDAKRVDNFQIGMVIDMSNILDTLNALNKIDLEDMLVWRNNLTQLPQSMYVYTDEHKKLLCLLKKGLKEG